VLDAGATISLLTQRPERSALAMDFDGSLSQIVDRPEEALPHPAVVPLLSRLVPRFGRVAIVSGRSVEFLSRRLPVPGLVYAGLYGIETLVDGQRRLDERVERYLPRIEEAASEAERRLPGVLVERKSGVSVTLHWRTTPERADEVRAVAAELAERLDLDAPQRGRMAVELRPAVPVDKGTAVAALVDGFAVGCFAGDDAGDLPAFAALLAAQQDGRVGRAVRIGVLSPEAPAELRRAVDILVDGPDGLVSLLARVADEVA
jgi:trehalose 6-phosphate phosphatase